MDFRLKLFTKGSAVAIALLATMGLCACGDDDEEDDPKVPETETPQTYQLETVDLGLSVKWANMNVGASTPWDFGNYYAWGETITKDTYTETSYNGSLKYSTLSSNNDAATVNMGLPWRMPTETEMQELLDNCTAEPTTWNGTNGTLFTAKNGSSIFMPSAGWKLTTTNKTNQEGGYWARTGGGKKGLFMSGSFIRVYTNWTATTGMSVRAVCQ